MILSSSKARALLQGFVALFCSANKGGFMKQEKSVYFKAEAETIAKFNAEVKLRSKQNKAIFSAFLVAFVNNPDGTLKFLNANA